CTWVTGVPDEEVIKSERASRGRHAAASCTCTTGVQRKTDDIKARPRSQPGKLRNSALVKGARQTKQTRLESEYTALSSKGIRKF
ncbi:mCG62490, partial [Mus musculus]